MIVHQSVAMPGCTYSSDNGRCLEDGYYCALVDNNQVLIVIGGHDVT